ncbi:hypothetical protein [Streptomyces sp. 8N706]|uniref:hypothetical protein n=1 Tax=Streptomyces sp. 8N706 TaxID=3457416 RepID=UPI003FCF52A2
MHARHEVRAEYGPPAGTGATGGETERSEKKAEEKGRDRIWRRKRRRSGRGAEGSDLGPVKMWHMVRGSGTTALCGRELDPRAATRPEDVWGRTREPFCHTCGATYLREVP